MLFLPKNNIFWTFLFNSDQFVLYLKKELWLNTKKCCKTYFAWKEDWFPFFNILSPLVPKALLSCSRSVRIRAVLPELRALLQELRARDWCGILDMLHKICFTLEKLATFSIFLERLSCYLQISYFLKILFYIFL